MTHFINTLLFLILCLISSQVSSADAPPAAPTKTTVTPEAVTKPDGKSDTKSDTKSDAKPDSKTETPLKPETVVKPDVPEREHLLQTEKDAVKQQQAQLIEESKRVAEQITALQPEQTSEKLLQEATFAKQSKQLELDKAYVEQQNLTSLVKEQTTTLQERRQRLVSLQASQTNGETSETASFEERVAQQQADISLLEKNLTIEQALLSNLNLLIEVLEKWVALVSRWENAVNSAYQLQQKQTLEDRKQQERKNYFDQAAELQHQLAQLPDTASDTQKYLLQAQIQVAEYRAQLAADQLKISFMRDILQRLKELSEKNPEGINQGHQREAEQLKQDINHLTTTLSNRMDVLQQQITMYEQQATVTQKSQHSFKQPQQLLTDLIKEIQQQLQYVIEIQALFSPLEPVLLNAYQTNVRNHLMQPRHLPNNLSGWQSLLTDIIVIPEIFWQQAQFIIRGVLRTFEQMNAQRWAIMVVFVFLWLIVVNYMRYYLTPVFQRLSQAAEISSLARGLLIMLHLLRINSIGITVAGILLLMIWLANPPYPSVSIGIVLACFWLAIKFPINLAYLILLGGEKLQYPSTKDVSERLKLYKQLRWMIVLAGTLVILTLLAHFLPITPAVRDLVDTVFMLFLSITVFPVMQIRNLLIRSLRKQLKSYWLLVVRLTTLMIPLAILTVALMGVIGYLNLGWYVAWRLSLFLLVFTGWLISRGFLEDIINLSKNIAVKHSEFGLLWTQDIIPLFDKLFRVGLAILAVFSLFWINGWFNDEIFMSGVHSLLDYTVFMVNRTPISIGNVLLSIFTLWAVFWFSGWSKRVTYRWIYSNINDLGARSSLSIFTQYTVLTIGLLITMKVMGIDLTTLMVLLGGLGVGIGFGLQNIANNFVSGILLLIERPLRTGDIVTVGDNEGHVTQIGIRSLTIKKWNEQDAIIPNSELITSPFVNWTHDNRILRITLYVGISYHDDPHQAKKLIQDILNNTEDVLRDPEPTVTLWEFANSAINFRIDYYFDLIDFSGFTTRDRILFAIWDAFKTANITIPYSQHDVYVHTLPYTETNNVVDNILNSPQPQDNSSR